MIDPPSLTKEYIKAAVYDLLKEVILAIGEPAPPLTDALQPMADLPQFDSVLAEETSLELFTRLGIDSDTNPFKSENRPATVEETVDAIVAVVAKGGCVGP